MEQSRGIVIVRRIDVIEGTGLRIETVQFFRQNDTHLERGMIRQPVNFEIPRLNQTFHHRQAAAPIQRMHRLKTVPQLGHDDIAFVFQTDKVPDGGRIEKRHVACRGKHPLRTGLLQSGIEPAQTSALGNQIPEDRRIGLDGGRILRHHHENMLKDGTEGRQTSHQERFFSDGKEALVPAHSAAFAAGQEDTRDIGNQ